MQGNHVITRWQRTVVFGLHVAVTLLVIFTTARQWLRTVLNAPDPSFGAYIGVMLFVMFWGLLLYQAVKYWLGQPYYRPGVVIALRVFGALWGLLLIAALMQRDWYEALVLSGPAVGAWLLAALYARDRRPLVE